MTTRTMEIIDLIKNPQYIGCKTPEEAVIKYMSKTCICPKEYYTEEVITEILKEAFIDFISTCSNPSYYVRSLMDYLSTNNIMYKARSLKDSIIVVLMLVQVRTEDEESNLVYTNGFNEAIEKLETKWREMRNDDWRNY